MRDFIIMAILFTFTIVLAYCTDNSNDAQLISNVDGCKTYEFMKYGRAHFFTKCENAVVSQKE